jgi:hypothetical protein
MYVQEVNQKLFINSVSETPNLMSLNQMMATKAQAMPGISQNEELQGPLYELSKSIFDGTVRDAQEIIQLFNTLRFDDGTLCFSTSIKDRENALLQILVQLEHAPPETFDPSVKESVRGALDYLLAIEPLIEEMAEVALEPNETNGGKYTDEDEEV